MNTVGEYIKELIRKSGKTQTEVADIIGIKQPSLSEMLSDNAAFPKERREQILDIIKATPEERKVVNQLLFNSVIKHIGLPGMEAVKNQPSDIQELVNIYNSPEFTPAKKAVIGEKIAEVLESARKLKDV